MSLILALVALLVVMQLVFLAAIARLVVVRRERAALARAAEHHARPLDDLARSPHWWRRVEAARRSGDVARLGDRELRDRLLDDPHPAVQSAATASLAPLVDPAIVARLLDPAPQRPVGVPLPPPAPLRGTPALTLPARPPRPQPG